jgi:hypothetical protein
MASRTWLDTLKKSFVDVPIYTDADNGIATKEFLEASESLATLFDLLGSVAFNPVKSDILGNVKAGLTIGALGEHSEQWMLIPWNK